MAKIKSSSILISIILLGLTGSGCKQLSMFSPKEPVNLTMLVDCSSSVNNDPSSTKQSILESGKWWTKQAARANGGKFEVFIIGKGFDELMPFFARRYPDSFSVPVSESKRRWEEEFGQELKGAIKELPSNTGSGIVEGICRVADRLKEARGDKILVVHSDLRQVTPNLWNFERRIPKPALFNEWVKKQYLTPSFEPDSKVMICGFKPYQANGNTTKITSADYGRLREFWFFLFKEWGACPILGEEFNSNMEVM